MSKLNDRRKVLEAVVEAIERGDNPLNFLLSFGYKAPQTTYSELKKYAKQHAPEMLPKLPDLRKMNKAPKKDGMPNKKTETVADHMEAMQDAADEFFGKCEEMGLKVNGKEEIRKPDDKPFEKYTVTAVRHGQYGEFYRDYDHHCIDWRTPHGDEMSLEVHIWKTLVKDLPEILKRLGVEL